MSDTPENPKPFRLGEGDAIGFESAGVLVPVVWPPDSEDDARGTDIVAEALDVLRHGLILALEGGRMDGIVSRTAALAVLAGVFESPAQAADKLGIDRKAIDRGMEVIREGLRNYIKRPR